MIWLRRRKRVACLSLERQQMECELKTDANDLCNGKSWTNSIHSRSNIVISHTPSSRQAPEEWGAAEEAA